MRRSGIASRAISFFSKRSESIQSWFTAAAKRSLARWKRRAQNRSSFRAIGLPTQASAEIVDRVLSREINPEIVRCDRRVRRQSARICRPGYFSLPKIFGPETEDVDLGFVGEVSEVNVEPLRECIRRSITPVISPTAHGR